MNIYEEKEYQDFLKSLTSYEQQKKFIELIGKAIQCGIDRLSEEFKKIK